MFKYTLEQVKKIYEKRGCVFLDNEFLGVMHKHNYLCVCKNINQMSLNNFFKGKNCKKCGSEKQKYTLEEVKVIFKQHNCILISNDYYGYENELEFICSCGRQCKRTLTQFKKSKRCKACAEESVSYTLAEMQDMYASKGFKLIDTEIFGVSYPHNCICICGRPTKKSWASLSKGKACKQCQIDNQKFTLDGARNIFSDYGWELLDTFYIRNDYLHNAKCKCGNITKKRLNDLKRCPGCRKCGDNYIPTINELKKEFLENNCILLENEYINSHVPMNYICKCGNPSKINLNNWRNGKRCQICGDVLVYDMSLLSNVYLLKKDDIFKIGKNNTKSWRLVTHKNNGWSVLDKLGPIKGKDAHEIEKTIKECLRQKGIPTGANAGLEKFDGYTECWLKKDLNISSINELWEKI